MKNFLIFISFCLVLFSCNDSINIENTQEDKLQIVYYKKDLRENFKKLLKNNGNMPLADVVTKNAQECEESGVLSEYDKLILEFWNDITDEQREYVIKNFDKLDLSVKYSIIDENGNTFQIKSENENRRTEAKVAETKEFVNYLAFSEYLKDKFSNILIPDNIVKRYYDFSDIAVEIDATIRADIFINFLIFIDKLDSIESLLKDINSNISFSEFKEEYLKVNPEFHYFDDQAILKSSSKGNDIYDQLSINLADKLKDGDVVMKRVKGKAYLGMIGDWQHAGVYSEERYNANKILDKYSGYRDDIDLINCIPCIYSAQPDDAKNLSDDMKPDRPGYACLDTLNQYNRGYKCAIITPKGYTPEKGRRAVKYAKEIFYDTKAKYCYPFWELAGLGDTSHGLTNTNTYCSKIAYTAWKLLGVDLDGDCFIGNTIVPDDIFKATSDHQTGILWWKKTIKATASAKVFDQVDAIAVKEARRIKIAHDEAASKQQDAIL